MHISKRLINKLFRDRFSKKVEVASMPNHPKTGWVITLSHDERTPWSDTDAKTLINMENELKIFGAEFEKKNTKYILIVIPDNEVNSNRLKSL